MTRLREKAILILFGLVICVVILELGLRLGGWAFISLQRYKNINIARKGGAYRILCLGESTTAHLKEGSYPSQLQWILNNKNRGVKFSVINEGVSGVTTTDIVERLPGLLDRYHPDMVVTMMGINDRRGILPYEDMLLPGPLHILRELRVYKLATLLWLHASHKLEDLREKVSLTWPSVAARFKSEEEKLQKAIAMNPGDSKPYLELGRYYLDSARLQKAEEMFKRAIAVNPGDDSAYFELGRYYAEVARFKEAEELLRKAIAINPQNNEAYLELGRYYFDEGRLQDIEDFIQKNTDTPSIKNGEFYFLSGRHYIQVRRYQKAEEMLLKAIELNPNNYYAICALGHLYKKRGESEKAKKTYSLLDAIVLKDDKACTTVGSCYQDAGKPQEAKKLLQRAIKLNPQGIDAYRALSQQYRVAGRKQNAENILKKAITINPDSDKAYFVLGEFYVIEGRWSEFRKTLRKILKLFPEHYKIYKHFAFYYEWEGRFQEAEEMFQKALEMNPMSYHVYIDLGNCYEANGKSKEAETMFLRAITITPKQSYGYMKLGCLYKEMGRLQEAHDTWIRGLEINPQNCRIRSYLYELYVEQKRLPEAEELLQGSFATALQNYSIYLELGDYGSVAEPQKALDSEAKINKLVPYEISIINNYRKLREILQQKKIKLAVVQYPCRDIEPLKNIFEDKEGIIFVDNEDLFKTALKHGSYDDYFIDHFAGDFGHCTKKGNRLLAENVANAILKYIGL